LKRHLLHDAEPAKGDGAFGLPYNGAQSLVHLVPVPFEATVSYGQGTAGGPAAILLASAQVDLLDADSGRPHRLGIHQHQEPAVIHRWNVEARDAAEPVIARVGEIGDSPKLRRLLDRVNAIGSQVNDWVESEVGRLLDDGRIVGVVGGDHSVPFGAIRAHALRCPGMGILHVDAHFDFREAYEGFTWSHASIMHNVLTRIPEVSRIVPVGIRDFCDEESTVARRAKDRVVPFLDQTLRDAKAAGQTFASLARRIADALPQDVYISFDVDGLDPALCPHTGTPVPGGLAFDEACMILNAVVDSGRRIVGFDLVEVAPDPASDWDANVGARLLYKLIGATLRSRVVAWSPAGADGLGLNGAR
jgi:agmatinase